MTTVAPMTSSRPYLIRALNEWINDNNLTPHMVVDAALPGVVVPRQFVENGKIVLNISPSAVRDLMLGNDAVCFSARFSGSPMQVTVPAGAVLALYARENGQGMVFGADTSTEPTPPSPPAGDDSKPAPKPKLKLVK